MPDRALPATAWYVVLACLMTWPLVTHIGTRIPNDLGDPLLNVWILGWDARHMLSLLAGHWSAMAGFWNANIFYPEPLTLAYSDHLLAQAVQILPVYAISGNLILCYNLLLLSTFVLSGLGVFLLVRELTRDGRAAFVAGLLYAFALVRWDQLSHVQILSSQWMPFVLFGLRRYFVTRRWPALAAAAAALVAQNLSSGYYLIFFVPFVAAYALYEMWARRLLADRRLWSSLLVAGIAVAAVTVPLCLPYAGLRAHGLGQRQMRDAEQFGADVYSYLTPYPGLHFWAAVLRPFAKLEGCLFAGFVPWVLAIVGVATTGLRAWRAAGQRTEGVRFNRWFTRTSVAVTTLAVIGGGVLLFSGRPIVRFEAIQAGAGNVSTYVAVALLGFLGLLVSAPRVRAMIRSQDDCSIACFFLAATAMAIWLSFGPLVHSGGHLVSGATAYAWLYRHVPGFDGLRVPSRYAMLAALFLSVLAGFGARTMLRGRALGWTRLLMIGVLFLAESAIVPLSLCAVRTERDSRVPPAIGPAADQVYRYVRALPQSAVLIELPFNDERLSDNVYMFASTTHWRRLVNGRSGWYPPWYDRLTSVFADAREDPEGAWRALLRSGATHAIVHESLYAGREGAAVTGWLRDRAAGELFAVGPDHLFELPRTP